MKIPMIMLLAAAALLSGCGDDTKKAVKAVDDTVSAPVNYVGATMQTEKYSQKQIDLAYVNQAIQQFQAGEGRLPKSLQEMVDEKYLGKVPDAPYGYQIVYDAAAGSIKVVKK